MTIEYWKSQWSEAKRSSSLAPGYKRPDNWESFWNGYAQRYASENRERLGYHQELIDHLFRENAISKSHDVLDIGCGPGTFAIPLALNSAIVTGLDTAQDMLTVMMNEALHYGIADRIRPLARSWNDFSGESCFDTVLGANTPAIMNYESLMKMNRLARKTCCLIGYSGSYQSSLRSGLWQQIMDEPLSSRAFDLQYPFNILYLSGLLPNVRFFPYQWEPSYQTADLLDHYTTYFTLFGKTGKQVERQIREFLREHVIDGRVSDRQQGAMALIWWRVQPVETV